MIIGTLQHINGKCNSFSWTSADGKSRARTPTLDHENNSAESRRIARNYRWREQTELEERMKKSVLLGKVK